MSSTTTTVSAKDEQRFFEEGRDWEADKEARAIKSERRAWTIAGLAIVVAVIAVIGISIMGPLKKVIPYVFAVDRATGNVELVSAADDRAVMGYQELTDKHWAKNYVVARESYFYKLLQNDYDFVLNTSADEVGRDYAMQFQGPESLDKKYGGTLDMRVRVLSVTLAHDPVGTKAVVRFERTTKRANSDYPDAPQYFVVTMAFEYKPSMTGKESVLIDNPLGFKVTAYRRDAEMAPTNVPVAPTVAAPAPVQSQQ